jgi:hypothetical protein
MLCARQGRRRIGGRDSTSGRPAFSVNGPGLFGVSALLLALFTRVRGRGILRTSPLRSSKKFDVLDLRTRLT